MPAKDQLKLASKIIGDNHTLIEKINQALIDVNGRSYLPLWMETLSNGRLENLSADCLQGVKLALMYSTIRMQTFIEENTE